MNAPVTMPVLLREDQDDIAVLVLNRPQARNSLSEAMIAALTESLAAIANDQRVRVVVLAANGPAFSAGHDMKEMTARRNDGDRGRAYFKQLMDACAAMMQAIVHLPKPVIACVQGAASAAGCQLVASCDLAVASSAAKFATPGVNIGLFCSTPMVALSRNVARKHAMEMLLTGDLMPAEEARRIGLINRVVAPGVRTPRGADAGAANRREIGAHGEDRQGSVLSATGNEPRGRIPLRLRRDGGKHAGARRRRGHRRVHRETNAKLGRSLTCYRGGATIMTFFAAV